MSQCSAIDPNKQYWVLGPINSAPFYFAYTKDKIVYLLTLINNQLIFSPTGQNPTIFTATQQSNGFFYNINNSSTLLSLDVNKLLIPSEYATALIPVTGSVNPWGTFLTGIHYTLTDVNNNNINYLTYVPLANPTIVNGYTSDLENDPVIINNQSIYAVPVNIYPCGSCALDNTSSVANEGCWEYNSGNGNGAPTCSISTPYFTNLEDCQAGIWYNYCGAGTSCSIGCKGPCPNGESCFIENGQFACTLTPPPDEHNYFYIIIIIAVFFMFFVFLFCLLFYYQHVGLRRRRS